jgi:sterol desaturase/sphingolipid hydroxylase (fatty acid hydroxylase superfamily)
MSLGMTVFGLVVGHMVASFIQACFHRLLGHGRLGGWIQALHEGEHHTIYSGDRLTTSRYRDDEKSLTLAYLLASLLMVPACLILPLLFAIGFSMGLVLSYFVHIFLHAQYHLSDAWFKNQAWFQRLRALHMVHHRHHDRNFAVIDLYWDKLMGTFQNTSQHRRTDAG